MTISSIQSSNDNGIHKSRLLVGAFGLAAIGAVLAARIAPSPDNDTQPVLAQVSLNEQVDAILRPIENAATGEANDGDRCFVKRILGAQSAFNSEAAMDKAAGNIGYECARDTMIPALLDTNLDINVSGLARYVHARPLP